MQEGSMNGRARYWKPLSLALKGRLVPRSSSYCSLMLIPVELGNYTIMQTVMLVEQMSLPVPNYVEAYLLFCRFPVDRVHDAVDNALGVVHGVWPDKLI